MAPYLEQSLAKLEEFEGVIPWMYRDTVGKVTVGVGLMLPDVQAALKLPFEIDGRAATPQEIAADFARVHALPMGRPALFYRNRRGLELGRPQIDTLLLQVVEGFEHTLRNALHGYDGFPDGVKLALLDMAYNLGPAGLLEGYPKLIHAVECGAWGQAAAACFRHGPGAARNEWTRKQFLANVVGALEAEAEGLLRQLGYGLVGLGAALAGFLRRRMGR